MYCGEGVNDHCWLPSTYKSIPIFNPSTTKWWSQYVETQDGTKLAADVYIANGVFRMNETVPTIVQFTRHGRAYALDFPFSKLSDYPGFSNPRTAAFIKRFVSHAYAWVVVDVRGTGASYGTKEVDFSPQEVQDAEDVIDWITAQSWSNGKVGLFGLGFDGITALVTASSKHPAIQSVALNGVPTDIYNDALYPGGVRSSKEIQTFSSFTHDTDRQIRWREIPSFKPKFILKYFGGNVYGVNGDDESLKEAVAQHANNSDLDLATKDVRYIDDKLANTGLKFEDINPVQKLREIADSDIAVYMFAGYYDMGVARSAVNFFRYLTNSLDEDSAKLYPEAPSDREFGRNQFRFALGPWSHAGVDNADPFAEGQTKCFWHVDELVRFFDYHMYPVRQPDTNMTEEEPFYYYSTVQKKWKSTAVWPPAHLGEKTLYFSEDRFLQAEVSADDGTQEWEFDPSFSANEGVTRWRMTEHLFMLPPSYLLSRENIANQTISFTSTPLDLLEITGEVELKVYFSVDAPNVTLFAYLEDVDPVPFAQKGEYKRTGATYITEAILDPTNTPVSEGGSVYSFKRDAARELEPHKVYEATFKFLPVSYYLKHGHQLRVNIAGTDSRDFDPTENFATKLTVHYGPQYPSSLKIPSYDGVYLTPEEIEAKEKELAEKLAAEEAAMMAEAELEEAAAVESVSDETKESSPSVDESVPEKDEL